MERSRFDEYIARFNAEDATAFDDFLAPDMHMQNGTLHYDGVQGMKDHYARIWGRMKETLEVEDYVTDGQRLAIQMHTRFDVLKDDQESPFGPVRRGERFDYYGLILYQIHGGKFQDIKVAYLDFVRTGLDGSAVSIGIPH
ncbi:MAG: nuclear transport factor 2 family protein [Pseudoxanthomonas sp.]